MMKRLRDKLHLRPILGNLLLSLVAVLVVLLVLEVILSRTHWFGARRSFTRPDPLLQWRFQPNADYWFWEENDHPITGRINSWGWRDRPRELQKPDHVFRVAVLGDSYIEAFQVEQDSTCSALAEDELNRLAKHRGSSARFELMNFGRSGFTQSEEWLVLLHDVGPFAPDLVVLFFYPANDIRDIHPQTSDSPGPFFSVNPDGELILDTSFSDTRTYRIRRWVNPIQRHSALVSLLIARLITARKSERLLNRAREQIRAEETIPAHQSLETRNPDSRYARNYAINKRLIHRMGEYCQDQNIRFLLVCMPESYQEETQRRLAAIDDSFDPDFFSKDLSALADSMDVEFLSLQKPFERAAANGETLQWVHWNYRGHALVASQLVQTLLALHPIDP